MSHRPVSSLFLPAQTPNPNLSDLLAGISSLSYPSLLKAHALFIVTGRCSSKLISRQLIYRFSRQNWPLSSLSHSILIHSHLHSPDPTASNYIIKSFVRRSTPSGAVEFFAREAHPAGCRPSCCTFPLLITAAKLNQSIHEGESFHCLALKLGFFSHLPIPNSLIHMYACCDGLDLARQLFDELPERDRVSYNSMIDGYVLSADFEAAEELFWRSPNRNGVTWSTLFNGYVRNRKFQKGIGFFRSMQENRVEPDDCSIVSLLVVYADFTLRLYGKSVHGYLVRKWSRIPLHVSSALVNFYCKSGLLDSALNLFVRIREKDLICYNTLISGLGCNGRAEEALVIFSRMLDDGMRPNDITFLGVLIACTHSELIEEGLRYFKVMRSEFGIAPTFAHYWCLVDLFVRVQRPHDALKVIQSMPLDNLSAVWGALIWLAKVHGDISVGESLGKRLIELEPDNSRRYLPLANVYAAASRWDKYRELQDELKARGLKQLPDCTLIDLNNVVHRFSLGDKSRPEIGEIYEALGKVAKQLKLHPIGANENVLVQSHLMRRSLHE